MKQFASAVILMFVLFLSACSFGYEVVIVNESDKPIQIRYKISEKGQFDQPMVKVLEDWNERKSIKRFWTEELPWQNLPNDQFETVMGERIMKLSPKQVLRIEAGNYNPISEKYGDLTDIIELKIHSTNGEISFKGKTLLNQFEKQDDYTFIYRYRDDLTNEN